MAGNESNQNFLRNVIFLAASLLICILFFIPFGESLEPGQAPSGLSKAFQFLLGIGQVRPEEHLHFLVLIPFFRLVYIAVCSAIPLVAAFVLGRKILRRLKAEVESESEDCLFATAIGMGALSTLTLLIGITIGLVRPLFVLGTGAICLWGYRDVKELAARISQTLADLQPSRRPLLTAGLIPPMVILIFAGFACLVPPLDYDVIEYHLGAPAYWFREGRISFIRYNVYSNFPFNTEMLYLFSIVLAGGTEIGALVAKCVNLQFGLLAAGAIGLSARRFFGGTAGWVAALTFIVCPWFTRSAVRAYDTLALSLFTFLAVDAFCCYLRSEPNKATHWLLRACLAAGLAMGTKYPSFLFVWVPLAAGALVRELRITNKGRETKRHLFYAVAVPLLLASPWLIKNLVYTGNPVYPLLGSIIESSEWDAERDAKFVKAHRAHTLGPMALVREAGRQVFIAEGSTPLLLLFLIPLIWRKKENRVVVCFLVYTVFYFICWAYFTHRIGRFLVPAIPGMCVLAGAGFSICKLPAQRFAACVLLGGLFLFHTFEALVLHSSINGIGVALGLESTQDYLLERTRETNFSAKAIYDMNKNIGDSDRVLFIGESETFYCKKNNVLSSTVFDRQRLDEALQIEPGTSALGDFSEERIRKAVKRLTGLGITHIYINWPETYRLQSSYAYEYEGKPMPGYLKCLPLPPSHDDLPPPARFQRFVQYQYGAGLLRPTALGRHLKLVKAFGPEMPSRPPLFALYRLQN